MESKVTVLRLSIREDYWCKWVGNERMRGSSSPYKAMYKTVYVGPEPVAEYDIATLVQPLMQWS